MATLSGPRWTGEVRLVEKHLADPLKWRRPRTIFVNSMSDLFHEKLTNEQIAAVFGVMAAAPRHTFQCLTKRPKRMREWFAWLDAKAEQSREVFPDDSPRRHRRHLVQAAALRAGVEPELVSPVNAGWPLPNVRLGVSVEDQPSADKRLDDLLACPAAVRWCSYEPALAGVDFGRWLPMSAEVAEARALSGADPYGFRVEGPRLDWIVQGGESGHGARPFDLAWARSTIAQCKAAGVPCFFKQTGTRPHDSGVPLKIKGAKGGDLAEWPEDLRVREWPTAPTARGFGGVA